MTLFTTKIEYMDYFKENLASERKKSKELEAYLSKQFYRLEQLTNTISQDNFWQLFPEILGIDAKLNLICELISVEDFSNNEIIQLAESDYRDYFKELCGYDLKSETKHSMVFNIR